jgi:hypothetical protein
MIRKLRQYKGEFGRFNDETGILTIMQFGSETRGILQSWPKRKIEEYGRILIDSLLKKAVDMLQFEVRVI